MLVIRLSRTGRKKLANYRIVAADSRRSATGKYVAQLGHYNPHTKEAVINKEAVADYIKKGAQPSGAMVRLLKKEKVALPKWAEANLVVRNRKPKVKEEKTEEAAKPAPASADSDQPATDAPKEAVKPEPEAETAPPTAEAEVPAENSPAKP